MNGKAAFFTVTDGRKGADEDKNNFETIFWRYLGLEPLTGEKNESSVVNLTKDQWMGSNNGSGDCTTSWVSKIKNANYTQCECVLLAFSSHGHEAISRHNVREPALKLNDTDQLFLSDVLKTLNDVSDLKGKPKIILWISCRYFTKYVENFQQGWPKSSLTEKGCPEKPDIDIDILTDKEVIFKCKREVDVTEYEIQYTLRQPQNEWKTADVSICKDDSEWIHLLIENLHPDTEYCFVIRTKNEAGLYGPFEKIHTRTFEQEDVGVIIKEIIEGPKAENAPSKSEAHNDGLWDKIFCKQKEDNSRGDASNNSKTDNIPFDEKAIIETSKVKSERQRRFVITKVDESKDKEVFSSDNIPNDFLIVYGTTRGGVSKRNENRGSWAVSSIEDVIREENTEVNLNFFHILTKAAKKMSEKASVDLEFQIRGGQKSILCFSHTLTQPIYFKKKAIDKPLNLASGDDMTLLAQKLNIK